MAKKSKSQKRLAARIADYESQKNTGGIHRPGSQSGRK